MRIVINEDKRGLAYFPAGDPKAFLFIPQLEGRRGWTTTGAFQFEPTGRNIEIIRDHYPDATIEDLRRKEAPLPPDPEMLKAALAYEPKVKNYAHQDQFFNLFKDAPYCALFAEQGTGKSKSTVDKANYLYLKGEITGVIIFALRGVHEQWPNEPVPEYTLDSIPWSAYAWKKKPLPDWCFKTDKLRWFTINIDAVKTDAGMKAILEFIKAHKGRVFGAIDESQTIANPNSGRTKAMMRLRDMLAYRMLITGTPISKMLADEWSQLRWLSEDIVGIKYVTAFRAEYCIMGGFMNRVVVGHRHVEKFKEKTAPYVFRVLKKDCLDLPDKIYTRFHFDLSKKQLDYIKELKNTFMIQLEQMKEREKQLAEMQGRAFDPTRVSSVAGAAQMLLRIQQITCGWMPKDDGSVVYFDNPRLEALKDKIAERSDKSIIIWARFQQDIEVIADAFKGDCVTYYGKTDADDRTKAKEDFIARKVRYFISNPEVGGTGLDGLQKVCKFAVYYSNSFKAIPRWQSEDRIHRIGMGESPEYCDLIARGGPDLKLLANLRRKLALSDMVLNNLIMDADTPDDAPIEDIPSTTVAFDPGMAEVTSAFDRRRK